MTASNLLYSGSRSGVWKGRYCGLDVVVEVIRMHSNGESREIVGVSSCSLSGVLPPIGLLISETWPATARIGWQAQKPMTSLRRIWS